MNRDIFDTLGFPDTPGVYFWRAANGDILYVGKATSLRDRVRSYFASDIHVTRGDRIRQMVDEAATITFEETDSVLEALILEANLIKCHQPPYNVAERDNKSFNYLVITNEAFPRVLVVRGRELFQEWNDKDIKSLYGPFPNGGALKDAMKLVRKIFPFRDKCVPFEASAKKSMPFEAIAKKSVSFVASAKKEKPCFNKQLGLCPGVCDGSFTKAEYARTIRNISLLFSGKKVTLLKTLEREMKAAAKKEAFESARELKRRRWRRCN
jgi:excinuclease ABC subunit C